MSTLIGVYVDVSKAEAVAVALRTTSGVNADNVAVGEARDSEIALAAEMDAEVAESWVSTTADQIRGALLFSVVCGAIGVVPGLLIGWAFFTYSDSTWTRLLFGGLVGLLFGSTVGALIGGGMAIESTDRQLAAEAGVSVRVDHASEDTASVMSQFGPLRLDRFEDGQRVETIATAGAHGIPGTLALFRRNAKEPRHRD